MNNFGYLFGIMCLLAAAAIVLWNQNRMKKNIHTIDQMLQDATDGTFLETTFDESLMSALETRFAHYLSAAVISSRNVSAERDNIKKLIADISHQTKTPISNLLLYSELLKEEDLPESAQGNADAIYAQAEKLRFLIDALVKLSRLENGIISLSPEHAPLLPMLRDVTGQFAGRASEKGLSLVLQETEETALFDRKWATEALCNIVDNAVKYTTHGTITISVTAYEMFTCIAVSDSGIGIPEEEQARIFSRFYRSQETREKDGVGIGLYLAREIISGEGGYIKVVSSPGSGSTFSVFLPR